MQKENILSFIKNKKLILILWFGLALASSFIKIGNLFGSQAATLSLLTVSLPVIAYFAPLSRALPLLGLGWIATHFAWPIPITIGIPTLLATLSWNASKSQKNDKLFHIPLSLLCMTLFCSNVGHEAWSYSLYWLIPLCLSFIPMGVYGRALKSTFIAHSVGSVIWAYFIPMSAEQWLSLIPVVALERLLSASLMVGMIGIINLFGTKREKKVAATA